MTELNKKIERCKRINGDSTSNNFRCEDRELAIENATETSSMRAAFDKFMEVQELLHEACEEEKKNLWEAVGLIRTEVGEAGRQAARNKGVILGKGRNKKDLFMTITIIIAAAGIMVNVGLLIYFK